MLGSAVETIAVDAVSGLFAFAAILNLSGIRRVRAVYRAWHYRPGINLFAGALELVTALLLMMPAFRIWGIVLGALIAFFSAVALLSHRQYAWSLSAMLLLLALIPVSLA